MKIGLIGAGAVGAASLAAILHGPLTAELVVVDRDEPKALGLATDFAAAAALGSASTVRRGDYDDLVGAGLVIVTAGVNEKAGGAADRSDPRGRLLLVPPNARVYADVVPRITAVAPDAVILVVTDPPDPLAELTRDLAGHDRVVSTGTVIDSLRFRLQLARTLDVSVGSVDATVYGEHGTSAVYGWSSARVGGVPIADALARHGRTLDEVREEIQSRVRFGNIAVIEGIGASQHAIGAVVARLTRAIADDERAVLPVAVRHPELGVTLGAPSVLGAGGVREVLPLALDAEERAGLERSAAVIREASEWARREAGAAQPTG